MTGFYRAFFECDGDATSNLTVDLLIDDRRRWVEKVRTAGWWGRLDSEDVWPLILKPGGQLDFGQTDRHDPEEGPRFGQIDISERILAVGERFTLLYHTRRGMTLSRLTDVLSLI
jgi:hypothetical protein